MQRNMAPDRSTMYQAPRNMVRWPITLRGKEADLGILTWTTPKATAVSPKTTHSMMSRQLFHAYVDPPHCRASTSETIQGTKNSVPKGSSLAICSLTETCCAGFFGDVRKKKRQAKAAPPMGRFM